MPDKKVEISFFAQLKDVFGPVARLKDEWGRSLKAMNADSKLLSMSAGEIKAKVQSLAKEIDSLKDINAIREKQAEMKAFEQQLDSVLGKSGGMSEAAGGVFKGSFLGSLSGNIAAKGFDMITGALGSVKSAMIDGNAEMERYRATLKTMLGSTEAADQRLRELSEFAASTPFELPEVVSAGNQLQSLGRYSEETLTHLGDLASAANRPFDQAMSAFSKLATGQKGVAVDMFRDLLISVDDWAAATGKGVKANGELEASTEEMLAVLPKILEMKGLSGMMAEQSATFSGLASTMSDTIAELGRTAGKPIFDMMKGGMIAGLELLGSPAVQGAVQGVAGAIGGLTSLITENGAVVLYVAGGIAALTLAYNSAAVASKAVALAGMLENGVIRARLALYKAEKIGMVLITAAKQAWALVTGQTTVAQIGLNVAMTANPIGLIIVAIGGLIAGLVLAYNKIGVFRAAINAIWATMKAYFNFLWEMGKVVIDILIGVFTLDFERAGKAIARTGDVVVKGMTDMATAGAKAYNEEMEKGRQQELKDQKKHADEKTKQAERQAREQAQAEEKAKAEERAAYMKEHGVANRMKELEAQQEALLANVTDDMTKKQQVDIRRKSQALQREIDTLQKRLDFASGKVEKEKKKEQTPAELIDQEMRLEFAEDYEGMDKQLAAGHKESTDAMTDADEQRFEKEKRMRELRIELIDNEARRLWEEYQFKRDTLALEVKDAEVRNLELLKLEKEYGTRIAKARKSDRSQERDEHEKRVEEFKQKYVDPVAQASTDLILSFADTRMTAREREQQFWNSMKQIALNAIGEQLAALIAKGLVALAEIAGLTASQAPIAAAAGSLWAGPAALASTATFGGAAVAGAAGLSATYTLAQLIGTPKFLADGGVLNRPTFVAGEAGAELVGPMRDVPRMIVDSLRLALRPETRRKRILDRGNAVNVGISVDPFVRGNRMSQRRQQLAVF